MADYFSKLKVNKPVDVQVMNELNILKEVWAEPDGTKIIILLTSSKTYSFGLAQWKFFRILISIINTLQIFLFTFIAFNFSIGLGAVQEVFPYKGTLYQYYT